MPDSEQFIPYEDLKVNQWLPQSHRSRSNKPQHYRSVPKTIRELGEALRAAESPHQVAALEGERSSAKSDTAFY